MKFHPKPFEAAFSTVGFNFDNCQPIGVKAGVKFGDSTSNGSGDMRLPHFVNNDDNDEKGKTPFCL